VVGALLYQMLESSRSRGTDNAASRMQMLCNSSRVYRKRDVGLYRDLERWIVTTTDDDDDNNNNDKNRSFDNKVLGQMSCWLRIDRVIARSKTRHRRESDSHGRTSTRSKPSERGFRKSTQIWEILV
jgi:hypothetical protein